MRTEYQFLIVQRTINAKKLAKWQKVTHFVFMSERLNAEIVAYLPFIRKILAAKRHSIGLTQDDLNEQLGYADRLVSYTKLMS